MWRLVVWRNYRHASQSKRVKYLTVFVSMFSLIAWASIGCDAALPWRFHCWRTYLDRSSLYMYSIPSSRVDAFARYRCAVLYEFSSHMTTKFLIGKKNDYTWRPHQRCFCCVHVVDLLHHHCAASYRGVNLIHVNFVGKYQNLRLRLSWSEPGWWLHRSAVSATS